MASYEEAKRYLKRYRRARARVEQIEATLEKLQASAGGGGINYDGMPKASLPSSQVESIAVEIADKRRELIRARARESYVMLHIESLLIKLQEAKCSAVLWQRYIHGDEWEEIAKKLTYSTQHVYRLHREGVERIACMLEEYNDGE